MIPAKQRPTLAGGRESVEQWARSTMRKTPWVMCPPKMTEWWNQLYSNSVPSVISGVFRCRVGTATSFALLADIAVPTLVIDASSNRDIDEIVSWANEDSRLEIGDHPNDGRRGNKFSSGETAGVHLGSHSVP